MKSPKSEPVASVPLTYEWLKHAPVEAYTEYLATISGENPNVIVVNLQYILSQFKTSCGLTDSLVIERIAAISLAVFADKPTNKLCSILCDCAYCLDCVGECKKSLNIMSEALRISVSLGDSFIIRRMHNMLGNCYMRLCEFTNAFNHYESAYTISSETKQRMGSQSALTGLVGLYESMGLFNNAKLLAQQLLVEPTSDSSYGLLNIINATNGVRLSYLTEDLKLATSFYALASKQMELLPRVMNISKAYFEAGSISAQLDAPLVRHEQN